MGKRARIKRERREARRASGVATSQPRRVVAIEYVEGPIAATAGPVRVYLGPVAATDPFAAWR